MSVTRTPRLAEIRQREDEIDRRKAAALIGAACFLAAAAVVLGVVNVPCTMFDRPPPPELVPVACVPSASMNTLPLATSEATAVVGVVSVKRAVPPPVLGSSTAGTSA